MPDELNTVTPGSESDGDPAESVVSTKSAEPAKPWTPFQRIFSEEVSDKPNEEQENQESAPTEEPPAAETTKPEAFKVYTTQEEHDRAIQAEVDRRETARIKRERAAEAKRLREEDPLEYVEKTKQWEEEDRKAEEIGRKGQEVSAMLKKMVDDFDVNVLDPLVETVPEAKRAEIIRKAPPLMEGRKYIVKEAIKVIQAEAEAAAEAKLRKNPAFRKELLRDLQDQEDEPPELIEHSGARPVLRNTNEQMNNLILGLRGR